MFRTGQRAHRLGRATGSELKKKGRSVGSDRPLGWTGKTTGWPRSAASGGAEGSVCRLGREARKGLAGAKGRFAQLGPKALKGRLGTWAGQFSGTARRAERGVSRCVTGKLAKWQQMSPQPYCDKAFRVCQNRLPKREMATNFWGNFRRREDGKTGKSESG